MAELSRRDGFRYLPFVLDPRIISSFRRMLSEGSMVLRTHLSVSSTDAASDVFSADSSSPCL